MRILTVSHFFEDHGGGIERVAGQLNRRFANLGNAAVWAASDSDRPPDGIKTVPLACANPIEKFTGLPMPVPWPRALRKLAREVALSDVVVIHDALYVTSIMSMALAKRRGKPVVLIQHIAGIAFSSRILRHAMSLANRLITQPMLRAANIRVFISDTTLKDLLGSPARLSCELIFNGVDRSIFYPAGETNSQPKRVSEIARSPGSRRILFVGRFVEKKGLSILHRLAVRRPDLSFFLAGSGPINPDVWGLANVHNLGICTPTEVADLYRWADVLLLPSVGEGYPLVIQEAMACGLPIICGEPSNRADPDARAWLLGVPVDLNDPQGSSTRFEQALDRRVPSRGERAAMARHASERYDWDAMAQRIVALAKLAAGSRPARVLSVGEGVQGSRNGISSRHKVP